MAKIINGQAEGTPREIQEMCERIRDTLLAKNETYGDSFAKPPTLNPSISPFNAILTRMSDKTARIGQIMQGVPDKVGESVYDSILDLGGYCVLALILLNREEEARKARSSEF